MTPGEPTGRSDTRGIPQRLEALYPLRVGLSNRNAETTTVTVEESDWVIPNAWVDHLWTPQIAADHYIYDCRCASGTIIRVPYGPIWAAAAQPAPDHRPYVTRLRPVTHHRRFALIAATEHLRDQGILADNPFLRG